VNSSLAVDQLAKALVESNDLLIGMYELADVTTRSLDEAQLVNGILDRASRIVQADTLVLTTPSHEVAVGHQIDPAAEQRSTTVRATHGLGLEGELKAIRSSSAFSTGDRKLLSAVLRTTLSAIETSRLHARAIRTALDARDTQQAAEVAQLALPQLRPSAKDTDIFFENKQAQNTGGDLFCFHEDGDRLSFAVGDVSGKGLSAAVMMTSAVCATSAAFRDDRAATPGEELAQVNDWMYEHLSNAGLFISMFIGHYHREKNQLHWANAGQSPCVVSTEERAVDLRALTPPLGVVSNIDSLSEVTELDDRDIVLIGSDGIVEQPTSSGEAFGEERLHGLLAAMRGKPASVIGSVLLQAVTTFADGVPQSDDRTAVLLRHCRKRVHNNATVNHV